MNWGVLWWATVAGLAGSTITLVVTLKAPPSIDRFMARLLSGPRRRDEGHEPKAADTSPTRTTPTKTTVAETNFTGTTVTRTTVTTTTVTVPPGSAKWSLSDSWATNITGLMAAFAAITAAFGDGLETTISKTQAAEFAVTCAVGVALAALGPLVYVIGTTRIDDQTEGTLGGVLAMAFVTLTAAFGTLGATAWLVSYESSSDTSDHFVSRDANPLSIVVLIVAIVLMAYAVKTLHSVEKWFRNPVRTASAGGSAGIITIDCCAGGEPKLKIALL